VPQHIAERRDQHDDRRHDGSRPAACARHAQFELSNTPPPPPVDGALRGAGGGRRTETRGSAGAGDGEEDRDDDSEGETDGPDALGCTSAATDACEAGALDRTPTRAVGFDRAAAGLEGGPANSGIGGAKLRLAGIPARAERGVSARELFAFASFVDDSDIRPIPKQTTNTSAIDASSATVRLSIRGTARG
jgi:hypothetical protein